MAWRDKTRRPETKRSRGRVPRPRSSPIRSCHVGVRGYSDAVAVERERI